MRGKLEKCHTIALPPKEILIHRILDAILDVQWISSGSTRFARGDRGGHIDND
jgi:hypothetical protein